MAQLPVSRRVVQAKVEATRGTAETLSATGADAIPLLREVKFTVQPISVERPTLRLSMTDYPDIYSGQARVDVDMLVELSGLPANLFAGASRASYASPQWFQLMRACGFESVAVNHYNVAAFATDTGVPMRHGETATITPTGGTGGIVGSGMIVSDFFDEDDILAIAESTAPAAGTHPNYAITTPAGGSSRSATVAVNNRDANVHRGLRLRSDINATEALTMEVLEFAGANSKKLKVKGAMGNVELLFDHGDAIKARFTFSGVYVSYADVAESGYTAINETHNVPSVFLGKTSGGSQIRIADIQSDGSPLIYGKDGATVKGQLNQCRISTGNEVVVRENSIDPSGITFALITDRSPTGSFNPDEIEAASYDFVSQFVSGKPNRLRIYTGKLSDSPVLPTPDSSTIDNDGNSIDFHAPGIVFSGLADGDRDGIHVWDASFKLSGGDYDTSAAGELIGTDNELAITYR